jgi:exodeoxyribonuclease X
MTIYSDKPTRFRVLDLETTGISPDDAVVEIAAVDIIGREVVPIGSDLVRPHTRIPPQASAVHHLTDEDVGHCRPLEELLPHYLDYGHEADIDVFASHNWRFDGQWLGGKLDGRPAICTYKCALRVWPDAPAHNNQALRYWLRPKGLCAVFASNAHRALPDAYVTAFLLRELLELATVEELVAWTTEPVLLTKVAFGKHRGMAWSEVPPDYLAWVVEKSDLNDDVKFTAEHYRRLR